jgi:hypothetical protein
MSFLYFIKIEKMKKVKAKTKAKRVANNKRATKRSNRLRASRKKVAQARTEALAIRISEKKKYEEFMRKMVDARLKGEL